MVLVTLLCVVAGLLAPGRREAPTRRSSTPSLYEEQERALTLRGEFEAGLVDTSGAAELEACDRDAVAAEVERRGVARLNGVVSPTTAAELRAFAAAERATAERDVRLGLVPQLCRFADVLLKANRADVLLPLDAPIVVRALREVLSSPVGDAVEALLGPDAMLRELSCLVADAGAPRQVIHPDTPWHASGKPVLATCFVALQDVERAMGPTLFLPGTNAQPVHDQFFNDADKDHLLNHTEPRLSLLSAGDASLFDSRTLHCGTANRDPADRSRYLFVLSFWNAAVDNPGNPGSIRPCYDQQLTLADVRADLFSTEVHEEVPDRFVRLSALDPRPPPLTNTVAPANKSKAAASAKKKKKRGFGAGASPKKKPSR